MCHFCLVTHQIMTFWSFGKYMSAGTYVYVVFTYIHITSCNTLAQYVRYLLPRQIHTTQIQTNKICAFKHETIHHPLYFVSLMAGSCTSELQLKVNCRLKVNCWIKFGLARLTVGRPAQIFSYNSLSVYNSLSAEIHLYMIWSYVLDLYFCAMCI